MQLVGTSDNPNHLSVGMIIKHDGKLAVIKRGEWYLLPSETIYLDETLEQALKRGAKEELGITIEIEKYLGSRNSIFQKESGINISKTTIYFLCKYIGELDQSSHTDYPDDQVIWVTSNEATKLLHNNELDEASLCEVSSF